MQLLVAHTYIHASQLHIPPPRNRLAIACLSTYDTVLGTVGSATTRPAPPLAPPPPTPSDITASSFKLSWACPQARGAPVTEYMVNLQHLATTVHSASPLPNSHSVLESLDEASSSAAKEEGTSNHGSTVQVRVAVIFCTFSCSKYTPAANTLL